VRRDGRVDALPVDGVMALLWEEFGHVPCAEHALDPGDRIVLYTDGITDRMSADGTLYDIDRLMAALGRAGMQLPGAIVEQIIVDLDDFAGGHEPDDDQTLLVIGVD
jgi:sigma-B regulation protein RsbU (phosphoserine phosphatase)